MQTSAAAACADAAGNMTSPPFAKSYAAFGSLRVDSV
jgi:hypothetical protein